MATSNIVGTWIRVMKSEDNNNHSIYTFYSNGVFKWQQYNSRCGVLMDSNGTYSVSDGIIHYLIDGCRYVKK